MIGFIIGIAAGCVLFLLLSRYTRAVTGGRFNTKLALIGVIQFFIPLVVLLGVAFLRTGELLWAGTGMTAAVIGCAVVSFIRHNHASGGK